MFTGSCHTQPTAGQIIYSWATAGLQNPEIRDGARCPTPVKSPLRNLNMTSDTAKCLWRGRTGGGRPERAVLVELNEERAVDDLDGQHVANSHQSDEGELDEGRQSDEHGDGEHWEDGAEVDVMWRVTEQVLVAVERYHGVYRTDDRRRRQPTLVHRREHQPAATTHLIIARQPTCWVRYRIWFHGLDQV